MDFHQCPKKKQTDTPQMQYEEKFPSTKWGPNAVDDVYRHDPSVFCIITREYNGNMVVFSLLEDEETKRLSVDSFWLDLDPVYRARKGQRESDRVELGILDHLGYGFTVKERKNALIVTINQSKQNPMVVKFVNGGTAKAIVNIDGQNILMRYIHVFDKTIAGFIPTVSHLEIHGKLVKTGEEVVKIVPNK